MSGHCIELPGYTSFAIKILKDVRINISGTTVKIFGGLDPVPADMLTRCLRRMGAWTQLSKVITDSEFPMFELCASFAVFNLNVHAQVNLQGSSNWRSRALVKLARVFNIEPVDDVLLQFFDLFPIAQNILSKEGVSNAKAWSLAVRRPSD